MNIIRTVTPVAFVAALSLVAMPAAAQGHQREDRGRQRSERPAARAQSRPQSRESRPQARESRPQQREARQQGQERRGEQRAVRPQSRNYRPQERSNQRGYAPRAYQRPEAMTRGRAVPRPYVAPRPFHSSPRYEVRRDGRSYVSRDRFYRAPYRRIVPYRPYVFARPYYAFRPRTHIGFGLWLGFGVPYPHAWVGAYRLPVYGYYRGVFGVVPNAPAYGGISFDISPAEAAVFVDGQYVGVAADFAPNEAPLTLVPGRHEVEVQADGYGSMRCSVDVVPGQVVPFQGEMQPY